MTPRPAYWWPETLMSAFQVEEALGISTHHRRQLVKQQRLTAAVTMRGRSFYRRDDVLRIMTELNVKGGFADAPSALRARIAAMVETHGRDHPTVQRLIRDLGVALLERYLTDLVAGPAPLADDQLDRLYGILRYQDARADREPLTRYPRPRGQWRPDDQRLLD